MLWFQLTISLAFLSLRSSQELNNDLVALNQGLRRAKMQGSLWSVIFSMWNQTLILFSGKFLLSVNELKICNFSYSHDACSSLQDYIFYLGTFYRTMESDDRPLSPEFFEFQIMLKYLQLIFNKSSTSSIVIALIITLMGMLARRPFISLQIALQLLKGHSNCGYFLFVSIRKPSR